ncbi:bifunctional diguanylate cyclase/phosphodiesterase [Elioraea tepidiphila]|jgi:diguanylate cyclase (GGDEF)-like protein|uniref:putative bifunctional diguanylate cyclase/phosphodiesterase n=1 Tax=Elioraea tepidiphila TaxID=457934 RepID=UPI000A05780D|nr:GGDEF and EAL domain-containing protein [Elioraea tepidiphila]
MPPAPLPPDEFERLTALRALEILDTPADERFDVFTRLAARAAGTPMAALSLLDADRQVLISTVGLAEREMPRDISLCGYTILTPDRPLVVPDATRDPRFADNPMVAGPPGIRFYAGMPVRGPSGHALGALCVADLSPRILPPEVMDTLADLARGVADAVAMRGTTRRLARLAASDTLAALADATTFDQWLRDLVTPHGVTPHAVLCVDLDRFATINHLFGHGAGDAVLGEAVARIAGALGGSDLLARLGGDSFAVLVRDPAAAAATAHRIQAAFSRPFAIMGQPFPLNVSIGAATCPHDDQNPERVAELAELALVAAKARGRNRVALARDCPDEIAHLHPRRGPKGIASALRAALIPGGQEPFSLAWQPVAHAATGALTALEALIRWPRPGRKPLMPGEFIAVAEARGLIAPLDRWVLRTACTEAARWAVAAPLAVNVSPPNLFLADSVRFVEGVLRESGLAPTRLTLEVTEGVLMHDSAAALAAINNLRALGVRVALDDFGAGHASFGYLRDFPFDKIKLDRELVARAPACRRSLALLRAVLRLARDLGAATVAEGVETEAQAAFLRAEGVDSLQGWLIGRPGPVPAEIVTGLGAPRRAPDWIQAEPQGTPRRRGTPPRLRPSRAAG